jgi:hypothetical protein
MRYDIRFAALAADAERRVRLAVRTLGVHNVETSVEPWQGSGCAAVVVDSHDGYGRQVMDVATRRGVAVLALGGEGPSEAPAIARLPTDASIATIAQALQRLLSGAGRPELRKTGARETDVVEEEAVDAAGLIVLAATERWRGLDLEARFGPRVIYLMRDQGRAIAHTLSDLIEARNQLCQRGWQFREIAGRASIAAGAEVTTSLDTLLVQAALRGEAQLTPFPDTPCSLMHWPDLGSATDAVDAMRIAAALLRRAWTPSELAMHMQLDPTRVHACLWAFDATGLLRRSQIKSSIAPDTPSAQARRGLWSRFAQRFGLASISTSDSRDRDA